jgi:hypothetical protein
MKRQPATVRCMDCKQDHAVVPADSRAWSVINVQCCMMLGLVWMRDGRARVDGPFVVVTQ